MAIETSSEVEAEARQFKVVGTRPIRHDGVDKVTGRAKYAADIHLPGTLYGKVLRSPHAHARIRSIDTMRAEALPGVKAVATARDFPIVEGGKVDLAQTMENVRMAAENVLASKKALYKGHAVAAVAATDPHIAEEALALIEIDYEVLPIVLTLYDALKPGAPLLHEGMTTRFRVERFGRGEDTGIISNAAAHVQFKQGDVEEGFKQAYLTVEREFTTETVHQGYIEPQASTAYWAPDGHVTIWTSTQSTFGIRATTAAIVGIPESMVKVIPMEIGGGFGAKLTTYLDPVAAILSRKSGKVVKMALTREEVFEGTGPTSASHMRCKIGASKDGHITGAQLYLAYEAGAFPGSAMGSGAFTALAPYLVNNVLIDAYDLVCNKQKVQAYRAPGSPEAAFAVESVVDELAEKLGLDPLGFRLRNATKQGDRLPSGLPLPRVGHIEVEEAMKAHPHYNAPLEGAHRGRGVAVGYWTNGGNMSSATINVNADGTISLITGSVDIGGTRTAVAMQAAEVLGLAAEEVIPTVADTDSVGWTGATGGSRIAFSTGIAAITAAEDVKSQMLARAAIIWEVQPADVEFTDDVFVCTSSEHRMTFKELAANLMRTGGPVTASATSNPRQVGPSLAGNIVDVEVDPETGKVTILRFTAFQEVGKAAHPSYVEGQMQGGTVQGIGWALNEEFVYDEDGSVLNASFLDYRMPTALDVPMIETVIVETPNPGHPFGLRGVGEVSIVPPMAAIANATYRAIGQRMTHLPMKPGAILEALEQIAGPSSQSGRGSGDTSRQAS